MSMTLLAAFLLLGANVFNERFDNANETYDKGRFEEAIVLYEELIEADVVSPEVFYNLGNAYYRMGKLGPAIANFERTLQIDPGFDNAQENLRACVRQTKRHLERPLPPDWEQSLLFWHYNLKPETTRTLAIECWITFWIVMGIRQWKRLPYIGYVTILLAIVAIAFGGSAWVKAHPSRLAVASREVVFVHYGTSDEETVRFELYDGDRVTVDESTDEWSRVTTIDGERGWARKDSLTFVGPPFEPPSRITKLKDD